MIWNFNKEKPSKEQYEALNILLWVLNQVFTGAEVKPHWWWGSNCPWKLFDKNKVVIVSKNKYLWKYNLTRYYSPEPNQSHYYDWKTYEQDVITNCWANWINTDWCSYPANNIKLKDSDALKVVACPSEFPLWTRFEIKWYWRVTCVDRGWAIKDRRLDLWAWYWELWLFKIENTKRPAGEITISNIDFSNVKK